MNTPESTHILFENNQIIISPDLTCIFDFLIWIQLELDSIFWFENQLKKIKKQFQETLQLTAFLAKKLEENNIDYSYDLIEHPNAIVGKFNFQLPIRSQFIVLFANLEVIFALYIAFQKETSDENLIRNTLMDQEETRKFLNIFLLSEKNEFYLSNKKLFSKISAKKLRELRNSLAHFFSVSWTINLIHNDLTKEARALELKLKIANIHDTSFLTPEDLFNLIKSSSRLLFKIWSDLYLDDPVDFKRKIFFVKTIVEERAAVTIKNWEIKNILE